MVNQAKMGLNQPVYNAVLAGWLRLARGHIGDKLCNLLVCEILAQLVT